MTIVTFQRYRPSSIPNAPGIYAFHLNPISSQKLGLIGRSSFSEEELDRAKSKLAQKIINASKIINARNLQGQLFEPQKNPGNRLELCLTGSIALPFDEAWLYTKISAIKDAISLIKVLEVISMIIPPLYIGITLDQSLKERYEQHFRDYVQKKENCFGGRLAAQSIDWEEIAFTAMPLSTELVNTEIIDLAEDILHGLTKPIFSYA